MAGNKCDATVNDDEPECQRVVTQQLQWLDRYDRLYTQVVLLFNPSDSKGNYSATSHNTKLVHWPLMGGLLHLVQRGET